MMLPAIVIGKCGENQLGDGWHERERDGRNGIAYRSTRDRAGFLVRVPAGARSLNLLLCAPVALLGSDGTGTIEFAGQSHPLRVTCDSWVLRTFPIALPESDLALTLRADAVAVPDRVLGNGDLRMIGWMVSAVWIES